MLSLTKSRKAGKSFLLILFFILFASPILYSQENINNNKSTRDWQYAIDTTWGAGLPTAQKLQLFDDFWNKVHLTWGGFPNLIVYWDSLKDYYRPIVDAGVSRGRFYGILCKIKLALNEGHVWVKDFGIDSTMGFNTITGNEYPNYFSFHYLPGIPLLNLFSTFFRTNFGAGVTALPDGSALVYSVMPNHPLNLQPGDIILGYDGIPWIQNLSELFEAELPTLISGTAFASSTESLVHNSVTCAGMNWGLFDTIDVVKYAANDTLHYPTSLLESITQPYFIASEQMPINGVPFPDLSANKLVSWGVVEGTNIGYIYVWDWTGVPTGQTKILFGQAVDELMHINNVDGLILDFRTNIGGWPSYANDGFKYLFNIDPTLYYSRAIRVPGNDHFLFTIMAPDPLEPFTPNPEIFDHPIAVLTGPRCMSAGDINAFRMRFHPMARFFGKKTACAYTDYNTNNLFDYSYYRYRVDNGSVYSNYSNEEYLTHKGFPVDEEVWLTRDGVANGQDDVVNRALEWMNNLVYPHNIVSDKMYYSPGVDSVHISTIIENPNSHQISARGYIHNLTGVLVDSVDMIKQVLNSGGENWTAKIISPTVEEFYKISVTAFDQTASTSFTLPNAARFTTVGPVILDSISCTKTGTYYAVKTFVRNQSADTTITNASVKLICNDPWVLPISPNVRNLPNIPPGGLVNNNFSFAVRVIDSLFLDYRFNFKIEVMSDGWTYWTDSMQVIITGVEDEGNEVPREFLLSQNYPNPFNPSTKISWQSPVGSQQTLKIYDILGNEIATLVDEFKPAGRYEVEFNATGHPSYVRNLPSGVYFYQLKAGEYISTKKMILLK